MADLTGNDERTKDLLTSAKRIAVVGASDKPERASHRIFVYLRRQGYNVVPVNPVVSHIDGVPCAPDLAAAKETLGGIDIVDVFRAAEHLDGVVADAVALGAGAVWGQLTVESDAARARADGAGLDYVMDRCILVEHGRLIA